MHFSVLKATESDVPAIAEMAGCIWHSCSKEELIAEFHTMLPNPEQGLFLAVSDDTPIGFAQCGLRHDYVEGTSSSPVGYLEGIYVRPEYRGMGCARLLLAECEKWAKDRGCPEFASDCELDNTDSLGFHLNVGFSEANRIICFVKKL